VKAPLQGIVTPEMRTQFERQMREQRERGNLAAAETIENFLRSESAEGPNA
jgi:hypothetical protein